MLTRTATAGGMMGKAPAGRICLSNGPVRQLAYRNLACDGQVIETMFIDIQAPVKHGDSGSTPGDGKGGGCGHGCGQGEELGLHPDHRRQPSATVSALV